MVFQSTVIAGFSWYFSVRSTRFLRNFISTSLNHFIPRVSFIPPGKIFKIFWINKVEIEDEKNLLQLHINPFHVTDLFQYPRKTENQRFSDIFRGYWKRSLAWNGLNALVFVGAYSSWGGISVVINLITLLNSEMYLETSRTSMMEVFIESN